MMGLSPHIAGSSTDSLSGLLALVGDPKKFQSKIDEINAAAVDADARLKAATDAETKAKAAITQADAANKNLQAEKQTLENNRRDLERKKAALASGLASLHEQQSALEARRVAYEQAKAATEKATADDRAALQKREAVIAENEKKTAQALDEAQKKQELGARVLSDAQSRRQKLFSEFDRLRSVLGELKS